jgi:hypothetical protein
MDPTWEQTWLPFGATGEASEGYEHGGGTIRE